MENVQKPLCAGTGARGKCERMEDMWAMLMESASKTLLGHVKTPI